MFCGDGECVEDRHWAGGHWAMSHLGAAMAQFRGRWHPVAACPHKDFKPVLLMPGQAMDDLYSTCPDCEHWK